MSQQHNSNFFGSHVQQEHGTNVGMMRSTQPLPHPRGPGQFQHLPADVKLPPSISNARDQGYNRPHALPPRSIQQVPHTIPNSGYNPSSYTNTAPVSMGTGGDKGGGNQSVGVAEIVRLLEETEAENAELRRAINDNNTTLANKLKDLENLADENKMLKERLSTSTNQFFEARVAVLGFKCRVMQLQAQGGSLPKQLPPPQQLGPHEINAQITTLTQEKKKVFDENKSLEAVISAEREKLRQLEDKKKIAEEERDRLQTKVSQLENGMRAMEDQLGEAQSHSYHEHSTRNQMSQQVRALERENQELQARLQEMSQSNTTLQSQVQSLKSSEKNYAEQVHQLQRETKQLQQAPVPKPRTNIQSPVQDAELERLRTEVQGLRKKLDEARNTKSTLESSLNKKGTEYQELVEKYNKATSVETEKHQQSSDEMQRLSDELSQLRVSDTTKEHSLKHKETVIERVTAEKGELQSKVASLEKQKQEEAKKVRQVRVEFEGKIASLEERLRLATAQSSSSVKASGSSAAMARRLNDALGRVKELETNLQQQIANFEGDRVQWEQEKAELKIEVEQLQLESGETLNNIMERLEFFEQRTKELEGKEATWSQEKASLQSSLGRAQQDLGDKTQLTQQLTGIREEYDEKQQEAAELRAQLENVNREKESKTTKLQQLLSNYSDLKENLQQAQERQREVESEKRRMSEENRRLSGTVQQLTGTKVVLDKNKQTLEKTVGELQQEMSTMMHDYQSKTSRLTAMETDIERLSLQNRQIQSELEEKSARVKQVESQRTRLQERLTHMDVQLKAYQEDFERERQAREAAVKVKNMVEERIAKKEKEVKELRDRLNQQAMHTLNVEEPYDDSDTFRGGRRQASSEGLSLSPTPPNRRSQEQQAVGSEYPPPGGEYRRSQEQHGNQPTRFPHDQEPPPPLPPRDKPPAAQPSYPSQSGLGQHFPGGHGGGPPGGHLGGPLQGGHGAGPGGHLGGPPQGGRGGGPGGHVGGPPQGAHGGGPPGGHLGGPSLGGGGPHQGGPHGFTHEPWTQQFPVSAQSGLPPRSRPMTTAQPGTLATAGSGDTARIGGGGFNPLPPQGGGFSQPPGDIGIRRPPAADRRNDFSDPSPPTTMGRNNLSGPQALGRNNLDMPGQQPLVGGPDWVSPGEVMNKAPPSMACPICGQQEFQTQTDLELHCAQCT